MRDEAHNHANSEATGHCSDSTDCSDETLVACPKHEANADQEAGKTPCGAACPSAKARAAALKEMIDEQMAPRNGNAAWRLHRRWDRAGRLFGETAMERLAGASVTVFGLGGVGSFAAEGLVRSGVGRLVLVDFDDVCVTNVNRQLHAMKGAYSKPKCDQLATRMRKINPKAEIVPIKAFYNADTSEVLLQDNPDFVIDAIDNFTAKLHLLKRCLEREIPLVSSMGAAGKMDPTQVRVTDLSQTYGDPMAKQMRKLLRQHHNIGKGGKLSGIPAVFSPEPRSYPQELSYDAASNGFLCVCPSKANDLHSCDSRSLIDGSAGFLTSVFGMAAASVAVRLLTGHPVQGIQPITPSRVGASEASGATP